MDAPRISSTTVVTSRNDAVPIVVLEVSCSGGSGTPQATSPAPAHRMTPPTTQDARKPRRAAAMAPTSGPMTCPTVIADCAAATCRRTSRGSPARPAMMKANVDTAPMKPSTMRETNSSGSVRATAMPKNPTPWSACTIMNSRLGSPRSPIRPQSGAVATVTSDVTPRIQPVHRSVLRGSQTLMCWMWNGRLTQTNDHENDPTKMADGSASRLVAPRQRDAALTVRRSPSPGRLESAEPLLDGGERVDQHVADDLQAPRRHLVEGVLRSMPGPVIEIDQQCGWHPG